MNSKQKSMQRLLDDVATPESGSVHLGPGRSDILEMVSREQARRKRTKGYLGAAAGAGVCALLALLFMQPTHPPQDPSLAPSSVQATPSAPPAITIHEVDDKELLELLKDKPVALMEWPDGKRTLLVVQR